MTDLDSIRVFLHLLGVAGWVGGQIVMVGLLPLLRSLGPDVPRIAAVRFARVAWPCFGLAVVTGIWSLSAVEISDYDTEYFSALLVELSVVAPAVHATTRSVVLRGSTEALVGLAALGAFFGDTVLVT